MAVGIPTSVSTAALGVLGITGAIVTYVASNYRHLAPFYVATAISAILMVWSVREGTLGIAELTNKGFQGEWVVQTTKQRFDNQSGSALLGLIVLGVAVVLGFTAARIPPTTPKVQLTVTGPVPAQARLTRDEARIRHLERAVGRIVRDNDAHPKRLRWNDR